MKWFSVVAAIALFAACGGATNEDLFGSPGGAPNAGAGGATAGTNSNAGLGGTPSNAGLGGTPSNAGLGGTPSNAGTAGTLGGRGGQTAGGTAGAAAGGVAGASGGGPSAGRGGNSGSSGHGGASSCDALLAAAQDLLEPAQRCDLRISSRLPCTGLVQDTCGCMVPVDYASSPAALAYREAVATALSQCLVSCPAIPCPQLSDAECVTDGDRSVGTCVASSGM